MSYGVLKKVVKGWCFILKTCSKKIDCLFYKKRPLVRSGDVIFYGSVSGSHVVKIDIKSKKFIGKLEIPNTLDVQLVNSAAAVRGNIFRNVKFSEKNSIYEALDLGCAWLERLESLKS